MNTQMHKTAIAFALHYSFRLARRNGFYCLVSSRGVRVDCPAWGETTAAGAIRMMRRRLKVWTSRDEDETRASDPLSRQRLHIDLSN